VASLAEIEEALGPLGELLAADGFRLSVGTTAAGTALLTVTAGPHACADCLVPESTFEAIALKHLRDRGLSKGIEIAYPEETPTP
jgi:hypothetical protein